MVPLQDEEDHHGTAVEGRRDKISATAREAGAQAGVVAGQRAVERAASARMVTERIERTHARQLAKAGSTTDFVKQRATQIREAAERAARDGRTGGAREQLKGHFIEALDNRTYRARNRFARKSLLEVRKSTNEAYDAVRIIDGKFAGGVQQKSSAAGVRKTIAQMEKKRPGSARKGVLRVPKDHVAKARNQAAGRVKEVKGMEFTSAQAGKKLDEGLAEVAKSGAKAGSQMRALAKGGAVGGAVSVGIGAVGELGALRRGEVNGREFGENRAVDAAEGTTSAVVGTLGASAGAAVTTAALGGTAAGASFATMAGGAGAAALGTVGSMGSAGAAVVGVLGGVTATAAIPAAAGGAVAIGAGVVVGKGFKRARVGLKAKQQQRRELAEGEALRSLPSLEDEP